MPANDTAAPRTRLLNGPLALAARLARRTALGWLAGLAAGGPQPGADRKGDRGRVGEPVRRAHPEARRDSRRHSLPRHRLPHRHARGRDGRRRAGSRHPRRGGRRQPRQPARPAGVPAAVAGGPLRRISCANHRCRRGHRPVHLGGRGGSRRGPELGDPGRRGRQRRPCRHLGARDRDARPRAGTSFSPRPSPTAPWPGRSSSRSSGPESAPAAGCSAPRSCTKSPAHRPPRCDGTAPPS